MTTLETILLIIFFALAVIKTLLGILLRRNQKLSAIEEDLTFVLEVLSQLTVEVTKIKEWIRAIENEQIKVEERTKGAYR